MNEKAAAALLRDLVHLDLDAIHAYGQAIKSVDIAHASAELDRCQADHERHVVDLSAAILDLGAEAPVLRRDVKGLVIEGLTALRASIGTEQSLRAMRANERLTNREYDKAMRMVLPPWIATLIERHREDERRHLAYLEDAIARRVWAIARHA